MNTIDVEIATLNLKTGEIDLYNTHAMTLEQLCDFITILTNMRDAAYKLTEEEIEDMCIGGIMKFNVLKMDNTNNKEQENK